MLEHVEAGAVVSGLAVQLLDSTGASVTQPVRPLMRCHHHQRTPRNALCYHCFRAAKDVKECHLLGIDSLYVMQSGCLL